MRKQRTEFGQRFGRRIRFAMGEAGLTTATLADKMGLSVLSVQRHMRGDVHPELETVAKYARVLGCSTDDLLMWAPSDSNRQPTDHWTAA